MYGLVSECNTTFETCLGWGFSALLAWRTQKVKTSPSFILSSFSTLFSSKKAMHRKKKQSKQRLHKSQFLQKLSCQKPYWDQARLSSLVNKQVGRRGAGRHGAGTGSYGAGRRVAGRRISGCQAKSARQTAVRCGASCLLPPVNSSAPL